MISRSTKTVASFYQRIGKYVILFASLGIVSTFLTILTVTLGVHFGDNILIGAGIYWNFNVFFSFMIAFIVTPVVILYVTKMREKTLKQKDAKKLGKNACGGLSLRKYRTGN